LILLVSAWCMVVAATAVAAGPRAWTSIRLQQGVLSHFAEGSWAEEQIGLMDRNSYTVAAAAIVQTPAATISRGLVE
jgi:hypothetical protein